MGAYADLDAYRAAIAAPFERVTIIKTIGVSASAIRCRHQSLWARNTFPAAGAAPTTAVVPDRTTLGALGQQNGGSGELRLVYAQLGIDDLGTDESNPGAVQGMLLVCDRLSHQGGLSGTVTTAQTTNLPTAALTRYTTGAGVMMALEIYGIVGTTLTTVTVSYTNQAGTAGQISQACNFGGTLRREVSRFILLPLAAGDTGVRSVESVTVLATTGTAGNFGVTLYKPIALLPFGPFGTDKTSDPFLSLAGQAETIVDDACLFFVTTFTGPSSTSTDIPAVIGSLSFAEA